MNTLSVMKAAVIALAFAPVAASADPITYFQLTQALTLDQLGKYNPSNGAYNAQPYSFDVITLPVASITPTKVSLSGTIDYPNAAKHKDVTLSNIYIGVGGANDGLIFADVAVNGAAFGTGPIDLFSLTFGTSDFTFDSEILFTADGTAAYKALLGKNPFGTSLNKDGSFKSGGLGGTLQGFTGPLPAPEPAAFALFGLGVGLVGLARRRAK